MYGFCVFCKYRVRIECKGSAYIRTDWEGDSYYEDYEFNDTKEMQGGELMEIFAENLKDIDCVEFGLKEGKWCFGFFNPHNGSGCDKTYTIEELSNV